MELITYTKLWNLLLSLSYLVKIPSSLHTVYLSKTKSTSHYWYSSILTLIMSYIILYKYWANFLTKITTKSDSDTVYLTNLDYVT